MKAIIYGATGMVGEGVLHVALEHPQVDSVLVVGRRSCGVVHPKVSELVLSDMFDYSTVEDKLKGYQACFFCLGTSSIGMKEPEYKRITYDLTMNTAETLSRLNTGMTFCYVSGQGTDGSEKGRSMWARVKGKTENDLQKLPFRAVYAFRPGFIRPIPGLKNTITFAKWLAPVYPLLKRIFQNSVCTLEDIGLAMIHAAATTPPRRVLENRDIQFLARTPPPSA